MIAGEHHEAKNRAGRGVHLRLKAEREEIDVHLGPEWYVENQETQIAAGDGVAVTGSRVTY